MEKIFIILKKVGLSALIVAAGVALLSFTSSLHTGSDDEVFTLPFDIITNEGVFIPMGSEVIICPGTGASCKGTYYPLEGGEIPYNSYKTPGVANIQPI